LTQTSSKPHKNYITGKVSMSSPPINENFFDWGKFRVGYGANKVEKSVFLEN